MLKQFFVFIVVSISLTLTACGGTQPVRVVSDAEYIRTELGKTETLCPKGQVFRTEGANVQSDVRTNSWSELSRTNRPTYDYYGRGRYSSGGVIYDQGTRAEATHQGSQSGKCVPIPAKAPKGSKP